MMTTAFPAKKPWLLLLLGLASHASSLVGATHQNEYLKEILLGRCYQQPPNDDPTVGGAAMCNTVVGTFMGILEHDVEAHLDASSFDVYVEMTHYASPHDGALFVWPPPVDSVDKDNYNHHFYNFQVATATQLSLTLPETTPGGSLLHGLVFCGTDQRWDCPSRYWEKDVAGGAMLSLWQAVYRQFAGEAQGRVRFLVQNDDDGDMQELPSLWKDYILPNLSSSKITHIEILASNCHASGIKDMIARIQSTTLSSIDTTCSQVQQSDQQTSHNPQVEEWCELTKALAADAPLPTKPDNGSTYNDKDVTPSGAVDCRCPSSSDSVYALLFWGLLVVGAAVVYSIWSLRHYWPDYQRIPDAIGHDQELSVNGRPRPLPKQ